MEASSSSFKNLGRKTVLRVVNQFRSEATEETEPRADGNSLKENVRNIANTYTDPAIVAHVQMRTPYEKLPRSRSTL